MKKLWELFFSFFKIGIFTIGGGMAMLPLVQDTVIKKGWLTESEMVDCLAVAQSLPGPVIVNTATFVGRREKGLAGSIIAALGVVVPSFICIIIFISILDVIGSNRYINGFFAGALSAAAGLVAVACFRMAKSIYKDPMDIVILAAVFILTIFFKVNIVWIILGSIPLGFLIFQIRKRMAKKREEKHDE